MVRRAKQFDSSIVDKCSTPHSPLDHGCGVGCVERTAGCESNGSNFEDYYQAVFDHRSVVGPEVAMGFGPTLAPNGTVLGGSGAALFEQHLRFILANSPNPAQPIPILREFFLNQQHILCGTNGGVPSPVFTDSNFTVLSPQFKAWLPAVVAKYLAVLSKYNVSSSRALIKLSDEPYPSDPCSINAIRTVAIFLRSHPVTRNIPLRIPGDVMRPLLPMVTRWDQNGGGFEAFSAEIAAARQDSAVELGTCEYIRSVSI